MSNVYTTISEPQNPPSGFALFRLGFRPFFLFGAIFGLFALSTLILWLSGGVHVPSRWDAVLWHQHEMLFGYAGAIIAGFLLTAVPNWTGHPTLKGTSLVLLVGLWIAGRIAVFLSAYLPPLLVGVVDSCFFLACALGILPALVKSRNKRNYFFILLLSLMALANSLTHMGSAKIGILIARDIVILMMVIVGGRVIPFFTEKALGISIKRSARIERFTPIVTIAALALEVAGVNPVMIGIAFLLPAIANGWRLSQWQSLKTLHVPLLWVLHSGYAWLVLGAALKAAHYLLGEELVASSVGTHAFTAGGIGVLTLGMMARVSLGHSGRALEVGTPMLIAFLCINLAAICRVFGVWLLPELTMQWFEIAGLCWLLAFGIFVIIYTPILIRPRADGRDG